MLEDVQAAILPGIILSFMIGPVFFVLLETSATKGFRAALVFDFGVVIADILLILTAYFSSFKLLENLSNQPGLFVFGGAILIIYGIITLVNKPSMAMTEPSKMKTGGYLALFIKGFLLNFINIGVLVFWVGLTLVVGPSVDNDPVRLSVFFGAMVMTYFVVDIFKILLAKRLKRKLTLPKIQLIKKILALLLIISGFVLITKGFLPKERFNIEKGIERIEKIK